MATKSSPFPAIKPWVRPRWMDRAACREDNPVLYDDVDFSVYPPREVKCDVCPVRQLCMKYGFENELDGVYGGTTTKFRKRIRAARNRKYCPDWRCKSTDITVLGKRGVCKRCGMSWNHGNTPVEHSEVVELSNVDGVTVVDEHTDVAASA